MRHINKTIIIVVIGLMLFVLLAWFFSNIFLYMVISIVLATVLRPLSNYLSKQQFFNLRMPRALAIFISFMLLIIILSAFLTVFLPLIYDQIQIFSTINFDALISEIQAPIAAMERFVLNYQFIDYKEGFLIENIKSAFEKLINEIEFSSVIENFITITGNFFIGLLAVTFITFFLLYEKGILRKQIISLIPNEYFEVSIAGLYKVEKLLSNYLLGLIFQMTAIFTIAFTGLSVIGVNYAASISLFAAIINLIPYLGPILGAIFGILVGLTTSGLAIFQGGQYILVALQIAAVFAVVQVTDNVVLQPLIFSKSVKAHPLEIFIVIFAGASLAGIVGMIAAIPVYTIIRVSAMEVYKAYRSYYIFKS